MKKTGCTKELCGLFFDGIGLNRLFNIPFMIVGIAKTNDKSLSN
ncbi:hypothetical protein [Siminovitchia fordii]|nr:hypothetical protein [Siminovitchia fordii]